jgi:hypothetical protein
VELAAGFNVPAQVEVWNLGEKLTSTMTLPSAILAVCQSKQSPAKTSYCCEHCFLILFVEKAENAEVHKSDERTPPIGATLDSHTQVCRIHIFQKKYSNRDCKGFVQSTMTVTTIQKLASEVALDKIKYVYMSCGNQIPIAEVSRSRGFYTPILNFSYQLHIQSGYDRRWRID